MRALFRDSLTIVFRSDLVILLNSIYSFDLVLLTFIASLFRRKIFIIPHGMTISYDPNNVPVFSTLTLRSIYIRFVFSLADSIVVTSELESLLIKSYWNVTRQTLTVSPSALYFPVPKSDITVPSIYDDLFLDTDFEISILTAGRMTSRKGIDLLFSVYRRVVSQAFAKVRLIVLGPFDTDSSLLKSSLPHPLASSIYIYNQDYSLHDFQSLTRSADVFLTCSPQECFGMAIYESLACSLPVICGDGTPWDSLNAHNAGFCVRHSFDEYVKALMSFSRLTPQSKLLMSSNALNLASKLHIDQSENFLSHLNHV